MWYRDAALAADRMDRLQHDAAVAAQIHAARPPRTRRGPGLVRRTAVGAMRAIARGALASASWIEARATDGDAGISQPSGVYHHS